MLLISETRVSSILLMQMALKIDVLFQHGITQANELVNLTEFFVNHIITDLKSPNSKSILKSLLDQSAANSHKGRKDFLRAW